MAQTAAKPAIKKGVSLENPPPQRCAMCLWWRAHPGCLTGNCIAEPPRIVVQVASQVPIYYSQEIPLVLRGSQFCVHPTTAAAEVCRLFEGRA